MTIRIQPDNIFDKILKFFGKKRRVIYPSEAGEIYEELGPY
jgi:hypothetical protein